MTDRPIIFSAPMVRALIEGRKFQTRRILKLAGRLPDYVGGRGFTHDPTCWGWEDSNNGDYVTIEKEPGQRMGWRDWVGAYRAGDRLWVREAFRLDGAGSRVPHEMCRLHRPVEYRADGYEPDRHEERPSIHMPRWASRLTLTVTDVRLQRLQDITEDDAQAEGLVQAYEGWATDTQGRCWGPTARDLFVQLFDSLHGDDAWEANPWVVALTFDVHRGNIDEVQP